MGGLEKDRRAIDEITLEELENAIAEIKMEEIPSWRLKVSRGHMLFFVLDPGASETILPKGAILGVEVKGGKSIGGAFRVAKGGVIPNLGEAKVPGNVVIGESPMKLTAQVRLRLLCCRRPLVA